MKKLRLLAAAFAVLCASGAAFAQKATVTLNADLGKYTINPHIYGHFAEHLGHCIYGGIWVGENSSIPNTDGIRNDVLAALKQIQIPNLRWPGGCFADEYHWMDGIGPRGNRPTMVNTNWGGVLEDNSFGTHEFLRLCELLGTEPYICGNVGSGTPQEMSEWVEYINAKDGKMASLRKKNGREEPWNVKFWGVGNENWGCGGNMTAEFYADQYRRFATFCRNYGDNKLLKIAGGANSADYNWTEVLMPNIRGAWGVSLHNYSLVTGNWQKKGSSTKFDTFEYVCLIQNGEKMDEIVSKHATVMDKYDPQKNIGLVVDEWGSWYDVEPGTNPGFLYQQNTMRDAILAGTVLNIFNKHADRVKMANIAQTVNVLQAMILTDGDKMLLTPSYWVFDLYKYHQGATLVPIDVACGTFESEGRSINQLNASASVDKNGVMHITLVNTDLNKDIDLSVALRGIAAKSVEGTILTSANITDHNTFEKPEVVKPIPFKGAKIAKGDLTAKIPARSVVLLTVKK